jgi:hypothetical protein
MMRKERPRIENYSDNAEQEDMVDGGASHVQILHRRVPRRSFLLFRLIGHGWY